MLEQAVEVVHLVRALPFLRAHKNIAAFSGICRQQRLDSLENTSRRPLHVGALDISFTTKAASDHHVAR